MADMNLTARWVFPVSGPPLERGVLMISDGRVVAATKQGRVTPDFDFGNAAIVPGFVNAHTHLDLTGALGLIPPTPDFTAWLRSVIVYRKTRSPEQIDADIQAGIAECLRHGTTTIGDIAAQGKSGRWLERAPVRSIAYFELIGMSAESATAAWDSFIKWTKNSPPRGTCLPGVSPHAPYSASIELLNLATSSGFPLSMHLGESPEELELLNDHTGPFVEFLRELNAWDPNRLADSFWEVHCATRNAVRPLFAHCNFLEFVNSHESTPSGGTIVYCPRTHAAFGHPPHPFRTFIANGLQVVLGTDSLASNPDLSLLAEARFIASRYADFDRAALLRMATLSGAQALGFEQMTGSLAPGKSADFVVVPLPDRDEDDPHELLFNSDLPVQSTWIRGERVFNLGPAT
jgi:aminodeoxyfutalosine deaminase